MMMLFTEANIDLAIVLRDMLYLDGGSLEWQPQLSDGSYGSPLTDRELSSIFEAASLAIISIVNPLT